MSRRDLTIDLFLEGRDQAFEVQIVKVVRVPLGYLVKLKLHAELHLFVIQEWS